MYRVDVPIKHNPLETLQDVRDAFQQLCAPLLPYYSEGKAHLELGYHSAGFTDECAEMEGFSRVLWGLAPFTAGGGDSELWDIYREGIRNGTNPEHEEYWGDLRDFDQKLVEMAAFGLALAIAPEQIWEPLSEEEKHNLYTWLSQINKLKLHDCNWLLFLVIVNIGFKKIGMPIDAEAMERNLERVEQFYLSNGWYTDGVGAHCDYYGPFAIHYYGLLYAALMQDEDPIRAARYKERAAAFARQFIYWFADDGSALPYGRSLSYRFSQAAFWGALVYAGVEPFPLGVMKGILLRHMRWWFQQPIFHNDGTLSVGYRYPNLYMSENYNSPGSPYWAFKSFLPLALDESHPFWQAEELPLPPLDVLSVQQEPHFIMCRQPGTDHVLAFNAGYLSTNEHTHTSAKYEKFVYSNVFGFSVPRAEWGISQGAFDSMLALSEGDRIYRVKRTVEEYVIDEQVIYSRWKPWSDVEVRTWLVAGAPWHVRVHRIASGRKLDVADGGFALGHESPDGKGCLTKAEQDVDTALTVSAWGVSGARRLYGSGHAEIVYPNTNTNIMHRMTVIPTVTASFEPGTHWLVSAFYGEPITERAEGNWNLPPRVEVDGDELVVYEGATNLELLRVAMDVK